MNPDFEKENLGITLVFEIACRMSPLQMLKISKIQMRWWKVRSN
jgi:hypothetical protein